MKENQMQVTFNSTAPYGGDPQGVKRLLDVTPEVVEWAKKNLDFFKNAERAAASKDPYGTDHNIARERLSAMFGLCEGKNISIGGWPVDASTFSGLLFALGVGKISGKYYGYGEHEEHVAEINKLLAA
jgi:hypothetical protein